MSLESGIWKNLTGLLKSSLTDPLSRSNWIRAGFVTGIPLQEPLIIVDQRDVAPSTGPHGIGSGKRLFTIGFDLFILVDSEQHTIDVTDYRGPSLRDYYANEIRTLFTDNIGSSMATLGGGVTDIVITTSTVLPYFDDLKQYRKLMNITIESFKL